MGGGRVRPTCLELQLLFRLVNTELFGSGLKRVIAFQGGKYRNVILSSRFCLVLQKSLERKKKFFLVKGNVPLCCKTHFYIIFLPFKLESVENSIVPRFEPSENLMKRTYV